MKRKETALYGEKNVEHILGGITAFTVSKEQIKINQKALFLTDKHRKSLNTQGHMGT